MPIPLTKPEIEMILDIIHYHNSIYHKGGIAIAYDPTQWDMKDFEAWRREKLMMNLPVWLQFMPI